MKKTLLLTFTSLIISSFTFLISPTLSLAVYTGPYTMNPTEPGANLDPDQDGFTNYEEFWARTEPNNTSSYPGKPANPQLNPKGKAILKYLALLPSKKQNKVLLGQHVDKEINRRAKEENVTPDYTAYIEGLYTKTGHYPALLSTQYDGLNADPNQRFYIDIANKNIIDFWEKKKGVVLIKWSPANPWTLGDQKDRNQVNIANLLQSGTPANKQWREWLDTVATGLSQLDQRGIVVLWRPMSEMSGDWFWWGKLPQSEYVSLWRDMFNYFTHTKKLNNLIWVYESALAPHNAPNKPVPVDYYYPGNDYVDVAGHNHYYDGLTGADSAYKTMFRYPKIYAWPQVGPDGDVLDNNDLLNAHLKYPRLSFTANWNSLTPTTGLRRIAIVDNAHASELVNAPTTVTASDLPNWSVSSTTCIADFNNDKQRDVQDLLIILNEWQNGSINKFLLLLSNWGQCSI